MPASAALEVARVRETLDVRNCKASRREDVDAILASIPDVDAFNDKLKAGESNGSGPPFGGPIFDPPWVEMFDP